MFRGLTIPNSPYASGVWFAVQIIETHKSLLGTERLDSATAKANSVAQGWTFVSI